MAAWFNSLPFFRVLELACPRTGQIRLDLRFASALPFLRHSWGLPLIVNSVCRSQEHNRAVGGHPRSLHLIHNPVHPVDGTMAADVNWYNWPDQKRIDLARLAWRLGWSVGLHPAFVHVDRRNDFGLVQRVFTYDEWQGFQPGQVSA